MSLPVRIVAGLALVALGVGGMALLLAPPAIGTDSPVVVTESELPRTPDETAVERGFVGVVVAGEIVDVAALAAGLVVDVRVRLGDRAPQNSVLARIDDGPLRDELAMAQAALKAALSAQERARFELDEAAERLRRWQGIDDDGVSVVSTEELSSLRYKEKYAFQQLKAAEARVAEQEARVKSLARRVDETVVRAPFDGLVAARYVDPGATVAHGHAIVRLTRSGELWIRFAIPEDTGSQDVRLGAVVAVRVEGLARVLHGEVEKMAPEVDPASRTIVAEARLTVPGDISSPAIAGRVARVHVRAQSHDSALRRAP